MKVMRFKMLHDAVTITILFESVPKWFFHFKKDSYDEDQLPTWMRLQIQ